MTLSSALIENLIQEFQAKGWKSDPMTAALHIAKEHPEAIGDFVVAIMDHLPEGGTFLDMALSFLPEAEWPRVVEHAVSCLEAAQNGRKYPEAASAVVSYGSLQCLPALLPHLDRVFALDELFHTYYGTYAWRDSGQDHFAALRQQLQEESEGTSNSRRIGRSPAQNRRMRAWLAMLETRCHLVMEWALTHADEVQLTPETARAYLFEVGYEAREGTFRPLYTEKVWHFCFEEGYLPPKQEHQASHPTWRFDKTGPGQRFGGTCAQGTCGCCHQPLHHLLTLETPPASLGFQGLPQLTLATCLSCLGWEESPLFYQHDEAGKPQPFGETSEALAEPKIPQFPSAPLRETTVSFHETPSRWRWQDWGLSNGRENLHRLGGYPCWIQGAAYPTCSCCQQTMIFLLQIDSELPLQNTGDDTKYNEFSWGSGGIVYGFWCNACRVSAFLWQCT